VFYQIYPRSFKDNDGDGIGDLNGIYWLLFYFIYFDNFKRGIAIHNMHHNLEWYNETRDLQTFMSARSIKNPLLIYFKDDFVSGFILWKRSNNNEKKTACKATKNIFIRDLL
jgi:hypothetical protein